jgi:hypothetical protein
MPTGMAKTLQTVVVGQTGATKRVVRDALHSGRRWMPSFSPNGRWLAVESLERPLTPGRAKASNLPSGDTSTKSSLTLFRMLFAGVGASAIVLFGTAAVAQRGQAKTSVARDESRKPLHFVSAEGSHDS